MKQLMLGALIAAFAIGCRSTEPLSAGVDGVGGVKAQDGTVVYRIPKTNSIEIPAGISNSQAIDAVVQAVKGTGQNEKMNTWASQWRLEKRGPNNQWIQIGLTTRNHYLCVCYRIENGHLIPDVPRSENLKQEGISIHRKVPQWINNMSRIIELRLYNMANPQDAAVGK